MPTAGKQHVRGFLSYCSPDKALASTLWWTLKDLTRIDKTYNFEFWDFKAGGIRPGLDWHTEVESAVQRSDFAILAVSRHYLASDYIHEHEAPPFLATGRAVPVQLETFELDRADNRTLAGRQIYRGGSQAFDAVADNPIASNAWVEGLVDAIHRVLRET
ncbi:toll/interleukin-1 receptor domain-containing protein [Nocardia sp. NPDC127606]|uniref:toll/interleukin-1 receptor domain-containing protein n=1 Tax=Nocardia sp. NPDC127606 TaxID=3345406 RepID=UPI003628C793